MEVKMKANCEGKKTKEEVVKESLEMYRDMFNKAEKQVAVLRKVSYYRSHKLIWNRFLTQYRLVRSE